MEIWITLLFLLFGLFWLWKSYEIKSGYSTNVASSVSFTGPYTFPMIIAWIIIVSALINLYQSLRRIRREGIPENGDISPQERWADSLRIAGLLAASVLYVAVLNIVGFILSTIILVFVSLLLFGVKSKAALVSVSTVVPVLLWLLFKVLIKVQLP